MEIKHAQSMKYMSHKWIFKTSKFESENVTEIWNALGSYSKTNIKWKLVIVGFNNESNRKVITFLNSLISCVAYRIDKYKMYYC